MGTDPGEKLELRRRCPDGYGHERTYLVFPDEVKFPLPYAWEEEEFLLSGNWKRWGQNLALYDETTRTGAVFYGNKPSPYWIILQPFGREEFFKEATIFGAVG